MLPYSGAPRRLGAVTYFSSRSLTRITSRVSVGAKEGVWVSKNLTMSFIRPEKKGDVIFTFTAVPSALSHTTE